MVRSLFERFGGVYTLKASYLVLLSGLRFICEILVL
jgi:hypothetical protein